MKKICLAVTAIAILAVLVSCASVPKLTGSEKFAIVSFALEKSIVKEGSQPDPGPGLLNSDKDKANYYNNHTQALNAAWVEFKQAAPKIFGASRLVDIASLENNKDLFVATKTEPNFIMGKDVSPAGTYLWPAKLNFTDLMNPSVAAKVAGIVKADILIGINYKAEYYIDSGISIGGIGGGVAKMRITATVTVLDSKGNFFRTAHFWGISDESVPLILNAIDPAGYSKLIVSAQKNLLSRFTAEIAAW